MEKFLQLREPPVVGLGEPHSQQQREQAPAS